MTRTIILIVISLVLSLPAAPKKIGYKLKTPKTSKTDDEYVRGSFMVASQCLDCNNGYRLDQITFSGFDKPQSSNVETLFITNGTDRTLSGVNLYIEYLDSEGRQLNKRFIRLSCAIPPGETRYAEIPTWDKQHSFYYHRSQAAKRGGAAFSVRIDPVAYYLRY